MYPALRVLSKASRWPLALGLPCQALWMDLPPPRMAFTKYDGLWYASAMTAAAPALAGHIERALRQARFGIATRVAQVVQEDDGVLGERDLRADDPLAEVLVGRVAAARLGVQAEPVLGGRIERVAVLARPAVAVAHVDHERGTLERVAHRRPRRIRRVELHHIRCVVPSDGCRSTCLRAVATRGGTSWTHDEDHLGDGLGGGRARRRCERCGR